MEQVGLVTLLRAAWLLATLPIVAVWLQLPGFGWLRRAILELTNRGKVLKSDSVSALLFIYVHNDPCNQGRLKSFEGPVLRD
ncbi:hypothetical protein Hanom_Chr17g01545021 [Helianthus anomalus]